jgi:hypothetical protein
VAANAKSPTAEPVAPEDYEVPILHSRIPASVGSGAFWAFVGIALAEVVDPPVATLIAIGFLVAGRRRRAASST